MTALGQNSTGTTVVDTSTGASVTLSWAAGTDVGNHRANNEDSYSIACPVFAVADGMGGHSAGDIASDCVVQRIAGLEKPGFADLDALEMALAMSVVDLRNKLTEDQQGAGTTVTGAALVQEGDQLQWAVFNIGDSRVYVKLDETFEQVTVDHSVVQQLVDAGTITKEEADYHPHANVITRAVGIIDEPIPDYVALPVVPGMRLLLCSDGLTKELTDVGIEHFLTTAPTATDAVSELMNAALTNSGRDNVTLIVIDVIAVTVGHTESSVSPA
ncbi:serine/threonine protein phosphatase PrpC [Aurantimicrobium minutum]|uniref:PP2C family protein-serine/threonine phosphatase n=1 Tax=Aurantimicrobium minutum TaxID=708131 RepID=UPI0024767900|nr:protein phosphatase 2C domain-containing protein [Aurantimicrobium minutum]MDH6277416.1 serine/threonine protein phosphatase PrpC [Aurantimicrobium minutum]